MLWDVAWYGMSRGKQVNFISFSWWLSFGILISWTPHTDRPTISSFSPFSSHNSRGGINLWIRHLLTPFMSPAATGVAVSPLEVDMRFIGCLNRSVLSYKDSELLLPSFSWSGREAENNSDQNWWMNIATKRGVFHLEYDPPYPFHPKSKHTRPTIAAP